VTTLNSRKYENAARKPGRERLHVQLFRIITDNSHYHINLPPHVHDTKIQTDTIKNTKKRLRN